MFMGLLDLIFNKVQTNEQKKTGTKTNHVFTDAQRKAGLERRRINSNFKRELKKRQMELDLLDMEYKKKEKIIQIQQVGKPLIPELPVYYEDDDDSEYEQEDDGFNAEAMGFMKSIAEKIFNPNAPQSQQVDSVPMQQNEPVVTEDFIKQTVDSIPAQSIKILKGYPDSKLLEMIGQKYPQLSPEQRQFALTQIKAK